MTALPAVLLVALEADRGVDADQAADSLVLPALAGAVHAGSGSIAAWEIVGAGLAGKGANVGAGACLLEEKLARRASAVPRAADSVQLLAAIRIDIARVTEATAQERALSRADSVDTGEARAALGV